MAAPSLDGITLPREGLAALRSVVNQHWRVLVQDYATFDVRRLDGPTRALHGRVFALLAPMLKTDPRRVVRVLRHPTTAGLLAAARRHAGPAGSLPALWRLTRELDLQLLTELSMEGELAAPLTVEPDGGPWPVLRSLAAHRAWQPPTGARITFGSRQILFDGSPATPLEDAYVELAPGLLFATSDNNPLLPVQAHPEREGNTVELGGRPITEWVEGLRAALALIERYAPLTMQEMRLLLETIVPVGYHAERHFSVSYEDSVGALYLTLHPNVMTMAEAIIHEFQHNKLNAVFRWDPLLHDAHAPLYSSPVRPDPRPLHGVLMAVHAFQPVAKLYEAMTAAGDPLALGRDWGKRHRQIVDINHEGTRTVLAHGETTPLGATLLAELRDIDARAALPG
jgi:HEXXH motif-containing protein